MTEKDNVSMATVQMKTDYAASEVYSTASEPPPVSTRAAKGVCGESLLKSCLARLILIMRVHFVNVEWRN